MSESKLFLEKRTDNELRNLDMGLNEFERTGTTNSELLREYADAWYSNTVGMERLMRLTINTYREVAYRWAGCVSYIKS